MTTVQVKCGDAEKLREHCSPDSVDLVFGSPPYFARRTYGLPDGVGRMSVDQWVHFMANVTRQALEISRGVVAWVVSGGTVDGVYQNGCERLLCQFPKSAMRPCIWTKNSAPSGNGGWFSNSWEYILCFSRSWPLPYFSVAEIATPLKYRTGGTFRQRGVNGKRTERSKQSRYPTHTVRRRMPNVVHATVGGGHMGSPLAHENEAPFPESLVEYFLPCLCPPGGMVLDPFCGSGTTLAVARRLGRNAIGLDIRESQVELSKRRLEEIEK